MTLSELIAKLEAAEEGSQSLDEDIAFAIGWTYVTGFKATMAAPVWIDPDGENHEVLPQFTTSLDAALPWEMIDAISWADGKCHALNICPDRGVQHIGMARTEPLARRVAALKAKEAEN